MPIIKDLTGQTFGRLTVIKRVNSTKQGGPYWQCKCECGQLHVAVGGNLRKGSSRSCGCLRKELRTANNITHNLTKHPLYRTWCDIIQRTTNSNGEDFHRYGGRGLQLHSSWQTNPESFIKYILSALGPKPSPKHSLDRIDNDKGYIPGNLRWATRIVQNNNQRRSHKYRGTGVYFSWRRVKDTNNCTPEFKDFKSFLAIMGEKPKGAKLARHDQKRLHGPTNSYWRSC